MQLPSGGGEGLFGKLIKPLTCEEWEAISTQLGKQWRQSDYGHTYLLDIICWLRLHRVNVPLFLKLPIMAGTV